MLKESIGLDMIKIRMDKLTVLWSSILDMRQPLEDPIVMVQDI